MKRVINQRCRSAAVGFCLAVFGTQAAGAADITVSTVDELTNALLHGVI